MSAPAVEVLLAAARRRLAQGDSGGAAVLLEELLQADPAQAEARRLLAEALLPMNATAAANVIHPLVQADPADVAALTQLARALSAMGRHDEAAQAFAAAAERQPGDAGAQSNLALALTRAGRPHEAAAAAERAIALDPGRAEAQANLGHALNTLHETARAEAAFAAALAIRPEFGDALIGLSRTLRESGRMTTALAALSRAAELEPANPAPLAELAVVYRDLGEAELARAAHRKAVALSPQTPAFYGNVLLGMQYDPDVDEAAAARAAFDWGVRQLAAIPAMARPEPDRDPDRPLRVGYVSADFYRHPVGWLGAAAIAAHDRRAVHVTCYANHTSADPLTEQLRAAVDAWVPVLGLDDASLAARIAADRIDVLVDLSGHTSGNRLGVFARRPAPVQASWLGYFATTGLATIDYVLLDDHHLVEGAEALFLETVVRLPDSRFCYAPPAYAEAARGPAPARPVTFGSFNNVSKLNEPVIALWSKVLRAAPADSLLRLKWRSLADPAAQAAIGRRFAAHGVDPGRLRFEGASPHPEMLGRYGDVDVALDPFPFCGGLTTCEALWMGVPVVTLPGPRPVSRQSHAILQVVGHPEWSARDKADYVRIAVDLARDPTLRARLRTTLPEEMARSPLCDAPRFARNLEAAYRGMWREHLALP